MNIKFSKHIKHMGPLLIAIAASLWAFDGIIRRSLFTLPPIIIVFYEHLIGSIVILPFIFKYFKTQKLTKKEFLYICIVALFSGLLGTLWFTTALLKVNFISFSVVFLLQKLQPIFAITTAVIFLKEKVNKKYIIWVLLAFVAAYFVTFKDGYVNFATGKETIIAALYAVGAAFVWACSTTFSKLAMKDKPDQYITGLRFIVTSFVAFIAVFLMGAGTKLTAPTLFQFSQFLLIAVSTGMVSILIYYHGLKNTQVKVSTIVELIYPLLAVVIDIFLYHSVLAISQYIAAAVLLFSIYQVSQLNAAQEAAE
jgi:drug/metabolite transporter (DMT)-like permease